MAGMTPRIEIVIDPNTDDGAFEYEVQGIPGGKCKDIASAIDKAMGAIDVQKQDTAELHQHRLPDVIHQKLGE